MKHAKKWMSLFLAVIMTAGTPLSALAAWEDGLVIPGQSDSSSSYDDLFWGTTYSNGLTIDSSSMTSDAGVENTGEEDTEESKHSTEQISEEATAPASIFSLSSGSSSVPVLSENYTEIYGTDSLPRARSATGTDPYEYLQANDGYLTITADRPLNNILHYDGQIVDNIHIAKWVADDPSILEYPAYCKNPGWKGTAQHSDGEYQIDPLESIGTEEKKILGVARAGYPYKTPAELGCDSVDEAYYATHGAIHTAIVNGSLDKWSIQSGDTARNTRVLNALKQIYNEGIANPYTPPAVTVQLSPVSGSEEATIEGDWIVNTYQFNASIDRDTWKFRILGDDIMAMVEDGTIEVYAGGTKIMPQTNVSGAWDTAKAFKVDMGDDVTVKIPQSLGKATGLNFTLYGTTVGGDLETAATYLGDPVGLSGNWQGYIYNFRPQGTDSASMTYSSSSTIPDTPEEEEDDPDTPTSSNEGSLVVEKLDYNTKNKVEDAVFHIRGLNDSNHYINIAVKATSGATEPVIGRGADIQISDGVIKLTGIPAGVYEVTEISAPPHYSVAVGQNSQSVLVEDDAEVHPKVVFENKPYGSLTIRKQDAHTQEELAGFYFKVANHTTGFETTVETGSRGEVTIEDLPEGSYEVTEIAARFDYILNPTPQIGEVDWGEETVVVMENERKPSIEIKKIDAETSEPIQGVHFEITHKNTRQVYMGVTDRDGIIELIDVEEGWYDVEEVTPAEGYLPSDKVYEVYAESGKPGTVTIKNTQKSGIMIEKVDVDGEGIEGVSFNIFRFGEDTPLPNSPVTTGKDGTVTIRDIDPGHYQIKEIQPANGYLENSRVYDVTVEEGAQKLTKVQIVNHRAPDLTIVKRDSQTGETLSGAMFTVEKLEDPHKGFVTGSPFTTDSKGEIVLKDLEPGAYKVCEVKAPNSYESGNEERIVNLVADEDFTAVFENTEKATLIVHKVDSVTKDPLKNARFEVYKAVNGSLSGEVVKVGEYTSDSSGRFTMQHMDTGWYRIVEKQAPAGYERKTESMEVFLQAGVDKEITFENSPQSAIIIRKVDAETGEALAGIRFEIRYLSGATGTEGTVVGTYATSKNGTITVAGLKPGVYSIAEVSSDSDHILDDTLKTVTLKDDNSVVTVEFTNAPLGGLLIKKMDAVTKEPLSDVIFKVTDLKGAVVGESNGEYRTDETGSIYIPQLIGGFVVQEIKTKDGYILDNTARTIYIEKGRVYSLEFFNQPENAFVIYKLDGETKEPLADAIIKVTTVDDQFIGQYTTDESGMITVKGLEPGTYKVQELSAPEGYLLDDTVHLVHIRQNEPQKLELYNHKKSALIILKMDGETKEPLAGAVIKISTADDQYIGQYTTDVTGVITVNGLKPGTYKVQEITAPNGYILDSTVHVVNIKQNKLEKLDLYNHKKAALVIYKMDGDTKAPLPNATIKVTTVDDQFIGQYTTDESGLITVTGLKPGTYKVQEISAPEGYNLDHTVKLVHMKQNESQKLDLYNYKKAALVIYKVDKKTQAPLAGAKFKVTEIDGTHVGEYITGTDGKATIPNLAPNWYVVTETAAPKGYNLDAAPSKNVQVKSGSPVTVKFENDKNASLRIAKTDAVTGKPMENVEFTIVREDGKTYGKHYTNRLGEIYLPYEFPAGTYLIRETNTLKGYALDTNVRKIKLDWGDDKLISWENYPLASIRIEKIDAETDDPIPGVRFEVFDKNKQSIGTYKTDSKGVISLDKMFLGESTYYIEELENEGYVVTKGLQTVKTRWGRTTVVELENEPIMGKVQLYKTAADNNPITGDLKGDGLKDAKFTIYDADGRRVDTLRTDKKGFAESDWLRYGKYTMKETTSPMYYLLNDETIHFEIKKDGQIIEIERENQSTILNTHVEKSGYKETMGGSVIRYDLYNIQNNSKVELNDFYLHESLPADAAYITRLFTGTFNQNLNYTIYYKTNRTGTFRILEDNLFTNKVYEIDCTKGLMAGEYITDIKYEFGTVEPGFKEVERPFIYCRTYNNLPNGYQFTNRVEVGGMYEMQKVKAEDSFTTKIYAPTVDRGKLPKTGY